jgi:predicted esterase
MKHHSGWTSVVVFACLLFAGGVAILSAAPAPVVPALQAWLAEPRAGRIPLADTSFAQTALTRTEARLAIQALWADHQQYIRATRTEELRQRVLELDGLRMKFEILRFTNAPATNGQSLFLSLHGGGGAPAAVNESQWRNQVKLGQAYRPQEGLYVAPRAPTDAWNLWHQEHIDRFFNRLIEDLIVLEHVNPNRVYVLGYSAGGDGVYQLGPRLAERWAAAAMMAGHPNEASPLGLRNVPFAIQVGAHDAAYRRNTVAAEWGRQLDELQRADPAGYRHFTELHAGKGHWMDLQDRKAIPWMEQFTRAPLPDTMVWRQDDVVHSRFYWLAMPRDQARAGQEITARRVGQTVTITAKNARSFSVRFNDDLVDLDRPVVIQAGGRVLFEGRPARTIAMLAGTLAERGDTNLVFSAEVPVMLP